MAKDEKTILDAEETVLDSDETVLDADAADATRPDDDDATMPDDATVLDGEAASDNGSVAPVIEKGASLLDTYRIESDAIEGGMGAVWRVHHTGWNVDLAMKRPKAGMFQTEKQKENFIRECDAWIKLGLHPHIVSCYYVRRIGDTPTIFSEWMDGGSLKNAINDGRLYEGNAAERVLDIALQFARGLHYAHEQGLIHQDVKPDNLLLTKEWDAKVADFGISKARATLTVPDADILSDATMFSVSGGYTPAYCSMEQMNGEPLTRRTDVYSWAISVMEMYLGDRPWQNGVIAGAACEEYFPAAKVTIPQKMRELLRECLKAKESERPYDFTEVEKRLLEIYREEAGEGYPRPVSKAAADTADSLNNLALTFLDLGKPEEAERCWKQALKMDPAHPDATYNNSLYLWRNGRITDETAKANVETVSPGGKPGELLLQAIQTEIGNTGDIGSLDGGAYDDGRAPRKVVSAALSTDGKYALTGDDAGRIFYWSMQTGECVRCIQTYDAHLYNYNADGDYVGTSEIGYAAWNVYAVQFWGKYAYSCSNQGFIKRVDLDGGNIDMEYERNRLAILDIAVSKDEEHMVSAGADDRRSLVLWNTHSPQPVRTLAAYGDLGGRPNAVCFCPDCLHVLCAGEDKAVTMWNIRTGDCVERIPLAETATCLTISGDGQYVFVGGDNGMLASYDLSSGVKVCCFTGHQHSLLCLCVSRGLLLSCAQDGTLRLWDTQNGRCIKTFACEMGTETAALSADGRFAIAGFDAYEVHIYDMRRGMPAMWALSRVTSSRRALSSQEAFQDAIGRAGRALDAQNIQIALDAWHEARNCPGHGNSMECRALGMDIARYCRVKSVNGLLEEYVLDAHKWDVMALAFNGDFTLAATSGLNEIKLWDISRGVCLNTFPSPEEQITKLCFARDEKSLLCCCFGMPVRIPLDGSRPDRLGGDIPELNQILALVPEEYRAVAEMVNEISPICMIDLATGEKLFDFENSAHVNKMLVGPGGSRGYALCDIFSGDGALRVYNMQTGKCVCSNPIEITGGFGISDDETLLLGLADSAVPGLYDIASGKCVNKFEGHTDDVYTAALSPDGRYLFSGGFDKTIRIWDVASGQCLQVVRAHTESVSRICITPDGRRLISGSRDNSLRIWEIDADFEFPGFSDWDETARPRLEVFLRLYPNWTDDDFDRLTIRLQYGGFGWLRPDGIRQKLMEMRPASGKAASAETEHLNPSKKKGWGWGLFGRKKK